MKIPKIIVIGRTIHVQVIVRDGLGNTFFFLTVGVGHIFVATRVSRAF